MEEIDFKSWLIRMSQGDEEAFRYVYESTSDHVYRLVGYLISSKNDIEDVMSEVYLELLRNVDKYDANRNFKFWFNGLIVRQARNWKRRNWRLFRLAERLQGAALTSVSRPGARDARIAELDERLSLQPILQTLPYKQREIIVLRYYQDCSLEEIAELLNVPLGTVKSRHHHALKQLRGRFGQTAVKKEGNGLVY